MQYRRSVVAQGVSLAQPSTTQFNLPVNPISFIMFVLNGLNVTDEATLAQIVATITNITVTKYGENVFNASLADLQKSNLIWLKQNPMLENQIATDNATRSLACLIPFSRKPYDPNEGLPATMNGELKMSVTASSTATELDGLSVTIETVEMLGAKPKQYMKTTTLQQTMVSGVDNDIFLPLGNKHAGLIVFSTTIPATTATTTTASKMKYLLDNVETNLAQGNWDALHGELVRKSGHREEYDGSADNDDIANYALVDFSPLDDDTYLVDTSKVSQAVLRVTAGDAQPVRVLVNELVAN